MERESVLENRVSRDDLLYSGLKDLDALLELISLKLEIANHLLSGFDPTRPETDGGSTRLIREKASSAVNLLEELRGLNISEDQKHLISEAGAYTNVEKQFQTFILNGGGVFFETRIDDKKKLKTVSRALHESMRKFMAPDDRYAPAFKTEQLSGFLRRLVNFFLPILAPEGQQDPPYGIEEGEQLQLSSQRMKMPLSQAIYYLENEALPQLEQALRDNPGSRVIQKAIIRIQDRLKDYKNISFRSRATPINLEKGFYTDWLSQYNADGELLVTVAIPVQYRSGTNLDRLREMVQTELVRKLAGKGIFAALDEDYRYRKRLESGRRGSSRLPSFKIDIKRGFQEIKTLYPALVCLEDPAAFRRVLALVTGSTRKKAQKHLENMIRHDSRRLPRIS